MTEFTHKVHPRSRSLKLQVKPSGEVVVTTPRFTPNLFIRKFVESHQGWIDAQLQKIAHTKQRSNLTENQILYLGQPTSIIIKFDPKKKIGVVKTETDLIINPVENNKSSIQKALDRFLKSGAQELILQKLEYWAKKMNITYNQVAFKKQTTRWGSCSSKGNLNFNWKLIHTPIEVIEYVIIHELAHRTHMDHSLEFWKLVEKFDPEYRIHRGWLKRKGMALE